jgi:MoxR-like ATPase
MEERQVTTDGITRPLPDPFFVIATQNPVETAGTFPLPEAQLDRFIMKLSMGLPAREEEKNILTRAMNNIAPAQLNSVCSRDDILAWKEAAEKITVHDDLIGYIADITMASRSRGDVVSGISPRGSIALMKCSRAYALIQGRDFVIPEDIKHLAVPVLAHRLIMPGAFGDGILPEEVIRQILEEVPVPTESFR